MKSNGVKLKIVCREDYSTIISPDHNNRVLCTIYRDDDSHEAAVKVLESLGFEIEEDGIE